MPSVNAKTSNTSARDAISIRVTSACALWPAQAMTAAAKSAHSSRNMLIAILPESGIDPWPMGQCYAACDQCSITRLGRWNGTAVWSVVGEAGMEPTAAYFAYGLDYRARTGTRPAHLVQIVPGQR